jgi:hypothetical protein
MRCDAVCLPACRSGDLVTMCRDHPLSGERVYDGTIIEKGRWAAAASSIC